MKFYDRIIEIENRGKRKSELEEEILKQLVIFREEYNSNIKQIFESIRDIRTMIVENTVIMKELLKNGITVSDTTMKKDKESEESINTFIPTPDTQNIKGKKSTKGKIVNF